MQMKYKKSVISKLKCSNYIIRHIHCKIRYVRWTHFVVGWLRSTYLWIYVLPMCMFIRLLTSLNFISYITRNWRLLELYTRCCILSSLTWNAIPGRLQTELTVFDTLDCTASVPTTDAAQMKDISYVMPVHKANENIIIPMTLFRKTTDDDAAAETPRGITF